MGAGTAASARRAYGADASADVPTVPDAEIAEVLATLGLPLSPQEVSGLTATPPQEPPSP